VTVGAGGSSAVVAASAVKDIAAGAGTVAVDRSGGAVKANGRATSATTWAASRLLAGAVVSVAGAVAAAGGRLVLANGEPSAGADVRGCLRPIAVVVSDRGLDSVPTVSGVSLLGASGVAAVLAGAVEDVEVGSVSAGVVAAAADETVEELVCVPPVGAPPELPGAIWRGAFRGPR
jgi:hypothetical protein